MPFSAVRGSDVQAGLVAVTVLWKTREIEGAETPQRLAELLAAVSRYRDECSRAVEFLSVVQFSGQDVLELTARAAVRRQDDALTVIEELCRGERGYAAVPLLRPACEEFIVLSYLARMTREQGERFVVSLARVEVWEDLSAQREYSGDSSMQGLGFSKRFIAEAERASTDAKETLVELGRELGWPQGRGATPSIRYFAQEADLLDLYGFLYHATSRFVHFKEKELLRRVWGKPPAMTISSEHFGEHWAAFALHWGMYLHVMTTGTALTKLIAGTPDDLLGTGFVEAVKMLGPHVPLITPTEVGWVDSPEPWE